MEANDRYSEVMGMNEQDRRTLDLLDRTLLAYVPADRYCLDDSPKDGCMVLAPGDGKWHVFFREGRLIEDVSVHDTLREAALQLIRNVAPSPEDERQMRLRFLADN